MTKIHSNTDPLIEEVLKNFFNDAETEEFSSRYLAQEQPPADKKESDIENIDQKIKELKILFI